MRYTVAEVAPLRRMPRNKDSYSYIVPKKLSIAPGSIVSIPFKSRSVPGLVFGVSTVASVAKLKSIQSVHGQLTAEQYRILKQLDDSFFESRGILGKLFVAEKPLRKHNASYAQSYNTRKIKSISIASSTGYVLYHTNDECDSIIASEAQGRNTEQILIIVPEYGIAQRVVRGLHEQPLVIPPKQKKNEYYHAVEKSRTAPIIVGTPHSVFLPFTNLKKIIVVDAENKIFTATEQSPRISLTEIIGDIVGVYGCSILFLGVSPNIRLLHSQLEQKQKVQSVGNRSPVKIIDMNTERSVGLKGPLATDIETLIENKTRVALIVNRFDKSDTHSELAQKPQSISTVAEFVQKTNKGIEIGIVSSQHTDDSARLQKAQVIIGTNKLFSIPSFTIDTVVFITPDLDLHIPSVYAAESLRHYIQRARSFSSHCLIQTYDPSHYLYTTLDAVQKFYAEEIHWRKSLGYPPFGTLLAITARADSQEENTMNVELLASDFKKFSFFGPFTKKVGKKYISEIIIKTTVSENLKIDDALSSSYNSVHIEKNPYLLAL